MKEWFEFAAFSLTRSLVLLMPLRTAQRFGRAVGTLAYYLMRNRRNIALDNLRHAFPAFSAQRLNEIAKGAFRNYGTAMMELLWFPRLTDDAMASLVKIQNPERIKEACARGKGLILLSGHFANWELIAFAVAHLSRVPFTIIVQTQNNARVDKVINEHRCLRGNRVVPMGMSVREIIKTLNDKKVIAIAPDQSGPKEGTYVEFFGRIVATHQGPAVFALRTGAPLQMGFMMRLADGTYSVRLEDIPTDDLEGDNEDHVRELTQRHTALLERYIREYPDHWLWMHRRWKHVQEGVRNTTRAA